jgi:hypothetical protein
VDNCVGWCDSQDGKVVVTKANCVGDAEGLGFGIDDAMAAVIIRSSQQDDIDGTARPVLLCPSS